MNGAGGVGFAPGAIDAVVSLRVILIAAAVWILWAIFRKLVVARKARDRNGTRATPSAEKMVACAVCETFVPVSEAISARGKHFCSRGHEREDRAEH
jgi:hypothetical protein